MGNKKARPKTTIFLIFKKAFLKEFRSSIKSQRERKANSIATGILIVKAKPNKSPAITKLINFGLVLVSNRTPMRVGKSIKTSALAILPSKNGIELRITKTKVAIFEALTERKK
jgi:hypothetical protein